MAYIMASAFSYILLSALFADVLSPVQTGIVMLIVSIPLFIAFAVEWNEGRRW